MTPLSAVYIMVLLWTVCLRTNDELETWKPDLPRNTGGGEEEGEGGGRNWGMDWKDELLTADAYADESTFTA
jgi:hypothetical protein